jgi:hypothetical protein
MMLTSATRPIFLANGKRSLGFYPRSARGSDLAYSTFHAISASDLNDWEQIPGLNLAFCKTHTIDEKLFVFTGLLQL